MSSRVPSTSRTDPVSTRPVSPFARGPDRRGRRRPCLRTRRRRPGVATRAGGELMLIAIYEEPLLEPVVPLRRVGRARGSRLARCWRRPEIRSPRRRGSWSIRTPGLAGPMSRFGARAPRPACVGSGRRAGDGQLRLGRESAGSPLPPRVPTGDRTTRHEQPRSAAAQADRRRIRRRARSSGRPRVGRVARAGGRSTARGARSHRRSCPWRTRSRAGGPKGDAVVAKRTKSLLERTLAASRATGAAVRVDVTPGDATHRCLGMPPG